MTKKVVKKIVLDLDDTLNSLTMYLLGKLGCNVGPFEYEKYPNNCKYNVIAAWAELSGRKEVSGDMFWEWVNSKVWEEAPKSKEFWIVEHCANLVGQKNVMIATSPTKSADCHSGKYHWIMKNLPEWLHRQYCITPRKYWLAQEGVLLIDDFDKNIIDFQENGGYALLVPRPWNSLRGLHPSSYLSIAMETFDYIFES